MNKLSLVRIVLPAVMLMALVAPLVARAQSTPPVVVSPTNPLVIPAPVVNNNVAMPQPVSTDDKTKIHPTISWAAVFSGAAVALALQSIFTLLGAGIGASSIDPYDRSNPVRGLPKSALIWWLVTGLVSLFIGGFVAGKLSGAVIEPAGVDVAKGYSGYAIAGLHGLVMWSFATIMTFVLLATSAGALLGGVLKLAYDTVSGVGKAAVEGGSAMVSGGAEIAKGALEAVVPGFNWDKVKSEARALLRKQGDGKDFVADPMKDDEEITSALTHMFGKVRSAVNNGDRESLVNMVAERTGRKKEEINKAVDAMEKSYQEAKKSVEEAAKLAEQKARDAASETKKVFAQVAIWTFVALVFGLVFSTVGGGTGVTKADLFYFF